MSNTSKRTPDLSRASPETPNNKQPQANSAFFGFIILAGIIIVILLFIRSWGWIVRVHQNVNAPHFMYCQSLKKITEVKPVFEDNGKYEDESYTVKYDDGTTGLVDQAKLDSGTYCVAPEWATEKQANQKGLVRKP